MNDGIIPFPAVGGMKRAFVSRRCGRFAPDWNFARAKKTALVDFSILGQIAHRTDRRKGSRVFGVIDFPSRGSLTPKTPDPHATLHDPKHALPAAADRMSANEGAPQGAELIQSPQAGMLAARTALPCPFPRREAMTSAVTLVLFSVLAAADGDFANDG